MRNERKIAKIKEELSFQRILKCRIYKITTKKCDKNSQQRYTQSHWKRWSDYDLQFFLTFRTSLIIGWFKKSVCDSGTLNLGKHWNEKNWMKVNVKLCQTRNVLLFLTSSSSESTRVARRFVDRSFGRFSDTDEAGFGRIWKQVETSSLWRSPQNENQKYVSNILIE